MAVVPLLSLYCQHNKICHPTMRAYLKYKMSMHSLLLEGGHLLFGSSFSAEFRHHLIEAVAHSKPGTMRLVKTGAIGVAF